MEKVTEENVGKKGKIKNFFQKNFLNIFIVIFIFIIVLCVSMYNKWYGNIETYTVGNGYVEKSTDTLGYIVKDESVASISNSGVAIPVIEQGKKTAKNEIIAIYKDSNYDKYLEEIAIMDKDIESLVKDLPYTYSSDVKEIENEISNISNLALKTTSYIKMQEYKNKLDELSYKKVLILGSLSPEGSKIRDLINEREEYETKSKTSSNNIKAPITGIVTYKIDGLENTSDVKSIFSYSISDLENIISKYSNNDQNKFGIKVVDNYEAYIVVKEEKGKNDDYISEGKTYNIKLPEINGVKLSAKLEKIIDSENYYYCILKLSNGIENIIDERACSINIVWKKVSGLAIPKHYIKQDPEKGYNYVTAIHIGQYLDIPVDIEIESDNVCIVKNMSDENLEKYNLDSPSEELKVYDQIIYKEG